MENESKEKQFVTIREAAKAVGLGHDMIRHFVKLGQVKGFYVGNRFYINLPEFRAALEAGTVGYMTKGGRAMLAPTYDGTVVTPHITEEEPKTKSVFEMEGG